MLSQAPATRAARAARATRVTRVAGWLVLATAAWVAAIWQMTSMRQMDGMQPMGLGRFATLWVPMMAAMMLPGAIPAIIKRGSRTAPLFAAEYLAAWTLAGAAAYLLYRPHGSTAAGALVIAAGLYELTPLKQHARRRCHDSASHDSAGHDSASHDSASHDSASSGFWYASYCAGSTVGLMLIMLALGVMSIPWMVVVTTAVLAQKAMPAKPVIDIPFALAIIALGIAQFT